MRSRGGAGCIALPASINRSSQAIRVKAVHRNGTTYVLNTIVNKGYKEDNPALEKVFNSFTLLEDTKPENLPEDRFKLWMEDARSEHDSIRKSTLHSIGQLQLTKDDRKALEGFIESFEFKKTETESLTKLYEKLGELKDEASIPFFEKAQQYPLPLELVFHNL